MEKVVKKQLPATDELPENQDLKIPVGEKKKLTPIRISIVFFLIVLITVCIALVLVLGKKSGQELLSGTLNLPKTTPQITPPIPIKRHVILPTSTPTPAPLPKGPQIYSVSSSKNVIMVKQLYIDNLDTRIGDAQQFRLTIEDNAGSVNYVSIKLLTDHKSTLHTLSLTSGNGANGVWQGSWTTDDQHDFKYQAQITIKDNKGNQFNFEPSFR